MLNIFNSITAGRVALVLYAMAAAFTAMKPAFPHASVTMDALSATSFQLALLATHPGSAAQALSMTFKAPEAKA